MHWQRSVPPVTIPAMTGNLIWTQLYVTQLPASALLLASSNVRAKLDVSVKCIGGEQRDFVLEGVMLRSCLNLRPLVSLNRQFEGVAGVTT